MFTIEFSTFIALVTVLVAIIFFLLIIKSKPSANQVLEMKEVGAEIVQQIQECVKNFECEKAELDRRIDEIKKMQLVQKDDAKPFREQEQKLSVKKESNSEIVRMHRAGYKVEEIAKMLNIQRGIIEVSLNFENLEAR